MDGPPPAHSPSAADRPTLELLLALSPAHRVPLDDLVGAPEVGDPRLRLKPGQLKGRMVIPLTWQPDGMQAGDILHATDRSRPAPAGAVFWMALPMRVIASTRISG